MLFIGSLFECLPGKSVDIFLVMPEEGEHQCNHHRHKHADKSEQQEVGIGEVVHIEYRQCAGNKAYERRGGIDALEEDTHDKETAYGSGQQAEDSIEVVEQ